MKAADITRADIANLMKTMSNVPTNANRFRDVLRKMFNMAEVWGMRRDGSNEIQVKSEHKLNWAGQSPDAASSGGLLGNQTNG